MIHLFLETETPHNGKETNEANFIRTIVEKFTNRSYGIDFDIIGVGGYRNLEAHANLFKDHDEDNYKNIVIFDADTERTDGGYMKRKNYLLEIKRRRDLDFEFFLYPNNKDDGIFENLLEHIVNPTHIRVLDYYKNYERSLDACVNEKGDKVYETPDQKSRMYAYISAFKRTNREKELFKNRHDWNFLNSEYWDLESEGIMPLRKFILNVFE